MHAVFGGLIALLAQSAAASPCVPTTPVAATIVVQAIDEVWLPVPGADVRVRSREKDHTLYAGVSDAEGYVQLAVPDGRYDIDTVLLGFEMKSVEDVAVGIHAKSRTYVQLQMKVAVPRIETFESTGRN